MIDTFFVGACGTQGKVSFPSKVDGKQATPIVGSRYKPAQCLDKDPVSVTVKTCDGEFNGKWKLGGTGVALQKIRTYVSVSRTIGRGLPLEQEAGGIGSFHLKAGRL